MFLPLDVGAWIELLLCYYRSVGLFDGVWFLRLVLFDFFFLGFVILVPFGLCVGDLLLSYWWCVRF